MKAKAAFAGNNRQLVRLVSALLLLSVFLLAIFLVLFNVSKKNILNIGHLNAEQMAQDLKYYMIEEIDEIALAAQTVETMQETGKTSEDILDYLTFESTIVKKTIGENYTGIYGYINGEYMDGTGWVPPEGYDPMSRPWYTGAVEGGGQVVYVTPYVDAETGTMMLTICKMLPDGKTVVALDVSLDRIQGIVKADSFAGYDRIIVTDKSNIVVAATEDSILGADISDTPLIAAYGGGSAAENDNGYFEYRSESGATCAVFSSGVEEQWKIFLIKDSGRLMRSLYYIYAILLAVIAAFVIAAAVIFDSLNKRRKAAEHLNIQLESIADIYISVHRIDLERDSFEEVKCMPYVREQIRGAMVSSSDCHETLERVMDALTREEYRDAMKEFIDFETLDIRMGRSNNITLEFLGVHDWAKARIIVLERKDDRITSFLWLVEDIAEEKRKQNELRYLSETDLMTGIRNRGSGERLIREALMERASGMLCLLDADNFKTINDHYGHDVGDEVIRAIADSMKKAFRASDIILRLGGDEFAVFAPGVENKEQARGVLKRFTRSLEKCKIPAFRNEREIEVSIGVTFVTENDSKDFKALYREADKAVYRSKGTAGTCVTCYSADIDPDSES